MEPRRASRQAEHSRTLEANYRRGYHHGLTQAMDLIFGLLASGIPTSAAADLCHVFEQQVITPWRASEWRGSCAPPRFDLEEMQQRLRAFKQAQSIIRKDDK